jgi:hypothetical protein
LTRIHSNLHLAQASFKTLLDFFLPPIPVRDALSVFSDSTRARWKELIEPLPAEDPARMPFGRYEIGLQLKETKGNVSLSDLLQKMQEASRIKHTGWGSFVMLSREPFAPAAVDGNIECWLGQPDLERALRDAAHCDFWRANPSGLFFLIRGFTEDATDRVKPGAILDVTLPIWRIGETMLYASRLAREYGSNDMQVLFRCQLLGLRGRRLDCLTPGRYFSFDRVSRDDSALLQTQATASQFDDNVVEVLHQMLAPLYERFAFFELPVDLVRTEIGKLRTNRF